VQRLFALALARPPTAAEQARFQSLLSRAGQDKHATHREVLEDLFWAVLSSPEFLFNH
jgi:hypothetical protein